MNWILLALACTGDGTKDTSNVEPAQEDTEVTIDDLSWVNPDDLPTGNNPCRDPIRVLVEDVIDGDTFVGQGEDGEERIRIIGVDTPETSSGDCYAQEAKTFLLRQIFGKWVWLTFDRGCTDVFDRTLAYVHLGTNEQDLCNADFAGRFCLHFHLMIRLLLKICLLKMKPLRVKWFWGVGAMRLVDKG